MKSPTAVLKSIFYSTKDNLTNNVIFLCSYVAFGRLRKTLVDCFISSTFQLQAGCCYHLAKWKNTMTLPEFKYDLQSHLLNSDSAYLLHLIPVYGPNPSSIRKAPNIAHLCQILTVAWRDCSSFAGIFCALKNNMA